MQEAAHLLLVQFLNSRSRDDDLMASHFSPLSPGQFHFVEGVDVGSPSTRGCRGVAARWDDAPGMCEVGGLFVGGGVDVA